MYYILEKSALPTFIKHGRISHLIITYNNFNKVYIKQLEIKN